MRTSPVALRQAQSGNVLLCPMFDCLKCHQSLCQQHSTLGCTLQPPAFRSRRQVRTGSGFEGVILLSDLSLPRQTLHRTLDHVSVEYMVLATIIAFARRVQMHEPR